MMLVTYSKGSIIGTSHKLFPISPRACGSDVQEVVSVHHFHRSAQTRAQHALQRHGSGHRSGHSQGHSSHSPETWLCEWPTDKGTAGPSRDIAMDTYPAKTRAQQAPPKTWLWTLIRPQTSVLPQAVLQYTFRRSIFLEVGGSTHHYHTAKLFSQALQLYSPPGGPHCTINCQSTCHSPTYWQVWGCPHATPSLLQAWPS